jgi:nicotinamidase-related amidase
VSTAANSLDRLLGFYDERGYDRLVGAGRKPALLVIDFSRAFTGGRSAFPGGDFGAEMRETVRLLEAFRSRWLPTLFTTIAYADPVRESGLWGAKVPWLAHCALGSALVEIDPALGRRHDEPVLVKRFPSAFFGTGLHERLQAEAVDTVVLAGCTTSVCIRATAIDAMQHGYRTLVAREAVGEFHPGIHALHLRDLHARYADVMSVAAILAYVGGLQSESAPGN